MIKGKKAIHQIQLTHWNRKVIRFEIIIPEVFAKNKINEIKLSHSLIKQIINKKKTFLDKKKKKNKKNTS